MHKHRFNILSMIGCGLGLGVESATLCSADDGAPVAGAGGSTTTTTAPAATTNAAVTTDKHAEEIKALRHELSQANKKLADQAVMHAESSATLGKLKGLFAPETKDPVAEAASLKANADTAFASARRAYIMSAAMREAAKLDAIDLEDVAERLAGDTEITVDVATGRVSDPAMIATKAAAIKASKPHWFKTAGSTTTTVAPLAAGAAPPKPPAPDHKPEIKEVSAHDAWNSPQPVWEQLGRKPAGNGYSLKS